MIFVAFCSILEPLADEEQLLMARIWDEDFRGNYPDEVIEGMMAHLSIGKNITWQNMYDRDVASRAVEEVPKEEEQGNYL